MRRCSGEDQAVCKCEGDTIFEGAVIGQVFTGEVRISCSAMTEREDVSQRRDGAAAQGSLSTALLSVGLWQGVLALPFDPAHPGRQLLLAGAFCVAAMVMRFAKIRHTWKIKASFQAGKDQVGPINLHISNCNNNQRKESSNYD